MLGVNMKNVDSAGGNRPGAGGYVIQIQRVLNRNDKQYIEIEYDIAEGEFAGYFADLQRRRNFWGGHFRRYYTQNAQPFFKSFIQTIQASNNGAPGLVIGDYEDIDETKLIGTRLGMIIGMEEYIGDDGKLKTRLDHYNAEFVDVETVRDGLFEIPELKRSEAVPQNVPGVVDTTADIPDGFSAYDDSDNPFC